MSDIKTGKKYFSVVFEVKDSETFQAVAAKITGAMAEDLVEQGATITACGWGDYATAYDALEHHVRANGYNAEDLVDDYVQEQELDVSSRDITG